MKLMKLKEIYNCIFVKDKANAILEKFKPGPDSLPPSPTPLADSQPIIAFEAQNLKVFIILEHFLEKSAKHGVHKK